MPGPEDRRPLPVPRTAIEAPPSDDPDEIRADIERTRERMSRTLERIEDRLVRRKDEIYRTATLKMVRDRIAANPWKWLAVAFVSGYVLAAIRD